MSLSVTSNTTSTGYEDIDNLNKQQNELSNQMYENQQNIINTQTQQNIADIERNKQKLEEETTKTNKGLYADYLKQVNPYGATAENLASNGLGNSGVAETTRTNLYNTYQKNRTNTLNTAKNLLADYNNEIIKAKQNGDMQLAQFAQELYTQKMNNLYNNYQLLQNKEQLNYQKERDAVGDKRWENEFIYKQERDQVADNQWQQQFDYNANRDQIGDTQWQQQFDYDKYINDRNYNYQIEQDNLNRNQWQQEFDYNKYANERDYNYQVEQDKLDRSQWQQEFNLSKKKASSSGSSGGSGKQVLLGDSGQTNIVNSDNAVVAGANYAVQAALNPQDTLANSLAQQIQEGKITREEASKYINDLKWV